MYNPASNNYNTQQNNPFIAHSIDTTTGYTSGGSMMTRSSWNRGMQLGASSGGLPKLQVPLCTLAVSGASYESYVTSTRPGATSATPPLAPDGVSISSARKLAPLSKEMRSAVCGSRVGPTIITPSAVVVALAPPKTGKAPRDSGLQVAPY